MCHGRSMGVGRCRFRCLGGDGVVHAPDSPRGKHSRSDATCGAVKVRISLAVAYELNRVE